MIRRTVTPRPNWEARLQEVGFTWFAPTPEHPVPYWSEDGYYAFTPAQIDLLRAASQELTTLVLEATGYAIERGRLAELGIPAFLHSAVRDSWEQDEPTVYMRLDLAYDGQGGVKLLEVNAQTPTSLLEAAVSQWQWLEDQQARGELPAGATQWNTIHEALTEQWAHLKAARGLTEVAFSSARVEEDAATVTYLRELAGAAGLRTSFIFTEDLGTSAAESYLLDTWSLPLRQLMWLWPFEFAWESRDSAFLASTGTRFIEPLWKAVTGSKGLLALLHELNPGHPHLLPATLNPGALGANVVRKPLYSREGQNVQLPGEASTPGDYGDLPVVEQAYTELPTAQAPDGPRYPVLGVWIAGDEVCGLGVREGRSRVTDNRATFAPHVVVPG
ncbi:glutathionylspermidine synthase family protein [Deinococcus aquaticus]|uniref:Glutathionylspermidine synthase family protein n=1 Tax=Deinococcus aquaticus TaxID=328692 RepID=A0ABY7V0A8_9DEIO|nr:glutathionylspermidine synthase family protein [Deinococcus aquaticus]WDA58594.1 glutathionylspermidine synthase family protein [Deinococcus aquaticus]